MLINKEEADKRLSSPMNLMNRLNELRSGPRSKAMELFGIGRKSEIENKSFVNPFQPQASTSVPNPSSSPSKPQEVIPTDELDAGEKLERVQHEALDTLMLAIKETKEKIKDLNPARAATVAAHMGKIVDTIRNNKGKVLDKQVHLHFYTPEQRKIEEFDVIDV